MLKVMIVDDEKPIRQWFEYILNDIPDVCVIGSYPNGELAFTACEKECPDVIFTDILMPVMNGIELIEKVREKYPMVEILILSNFNDFEYVHRGLKSGATDYFLKAQSDDNDIIAFVEQVRSRRSSQSQKNELSKFVVDCLTEMSEHSFELPLENTEKYENLKKQITAVFSSSKSNSELTYDSIIVNRLIEYLKNNYMNSIKLSTVALEFSYNPDYLSQLFKKYTGYNFNSYLTMIRMEKAKELLAKENAMVREVAFMVGYANEMYFSTAFKGFYGVSPKNYLNK